MFRFTHWRWALLAAIVLGALVLRAHDLSQIFLWLDDTDFFNENLYLQPPTPLFEFAKTTRDATTNTWGWPAIIWVTCRIFGGTITVARAPSVFVGTATVALMFLLVYRVIPTSFAGNRFVPAIFAATLTAIAMPQMEFSQRTIPYGAAPCVAVALLLAHLEVWRVIGERPANARQLFRAVALYTVAGAVALCIHPSLGLLLGVSIAFQAARAIWGIPRQTTAERLRLFRLSLGMGLVLLTMAFLNAKNPKYGFRPYLERYYHKPAWAAIPKLLMHAYDMAAYHLNLFYNTSLYWPERLNVAILPLVLLCILGWYFAGIGKFGAEARHLALLGGVATAVPAILSVGGVFPFGGVRQTLFLSPFLLAFTAMGFYSLRAHSLTRVLGAVAAIFLVGMWAYNLPRFYEERLAVYNSRDIVDTWRQSGELPYYAQFCEREIRYAARENREIPIEPFILNNLPKAPYLLVSTRWPLGDNVWFPGVLANLRKTGYTAALIVERPPKHPESWTYSTSLYFPPSGLWIYKVTSQ